MSLDGLNFILGKKEVIPTVSANDLLERPELVDDDYLRHVRTYVPINRAADGREGQLSVEEFERKVIKQIKDARAPRGYLTAEYGYGKTSTALYLWQRAEEARLIAVPPFQMLELPDLMTATYGWVHYRLAAHSPHLVSRLDQLYNDTTNFSIEKEAKEKNVSISAIQEWVRQGRFILDLQPTDYVHFFEEVTQIVLEAGFDGLLILPDEVQQYIEPKIKAGGGDPIAPFFNLIQGLATRAGYLCFGFIMVVPLKEIGVIREARGRDDLLHRMRELSLDLSTVYDHDFAKRLWQQLAYEFDFEDIARDIVAEETLEALGEIASREDLSNGPRTVINAFRRMVERYKTIGHANSQPYTPMDLVDDLMSGAIQFSGNNQIQNVARRALQSAIVRQNLEQYELAVKLAAAFPNDGVPFRIQKIYGAEAPLDHLMQQALGELVIAVGPIDEGGITLFGLQRGVQQQSWLPQTIRDFRRAYSENSDQTRDRALEVFSTLLKTQVFKGWKVVGERPSNFTTNRSIIFQGDFQSFSTRFPKRDIQVRILWEDEELKDATSSGDVVIQFHLSIYGEEEERRHIAKPLELDFEKHRAFIYINLMYVRPEGVAPQIQQQLQGVWSPYDLSPLVLMNIYQMLEEKRADNLIPRGEDQMILTGFQPDLLDNITRDILNAEISGAVGGVSQGRVIEICVERLLESRYGHTYHTLMAVNSWRDSLRKYASAIDRLENFYQRLGDIEVEGTKKEIADFMVLSSTGLDSFMKNFSYFLKLTREWQGKEGIGAVKFTLHPLEQNIVAWLRNSEMIEKITIGSKRHEVRCLNIGDVYREAEFLGYQGEEIEALIEVLAKNRGIIEVHQNRLICEVPSQSPDVEGVADHLRGFRQELDILANGFPSSSILTSMQENADKWEAAIRQQLESGTPDPDQIYRLNRNIQLRQGELRNFSQEKRQEVRNQLGNLRRILRPIKPDQITALSTPIEGSVQYVDQVNVLRTALRNHVNTIKGTIDQLNSQLEQIAQNLSRDEYSYDQLVQHVKEVAAFQTKIEKANTDQSLFETQYQQITGWQRLVAEGSKLLAELQQMEHVTRTEYDTFDRLSREIRAHISSQSKKLDVLPDYTIYESQLIEITIQVRRIREELEGNFISLQTRYRQALTKNRLYPSDKLDRPLTYNLSNPDESYRLLEEDIQRRLLEICGQMINRLKGHRQGVLNTLNTPLLQSLPTAEHQRIEQQGKQLLSAVDELSENLQELEGNCRDVTIIRDFPSESEGGFFELINGFVYVRDTLSEVSNDEKRLRDWLTEFALTVEEEHLLTHLHAEDIENMEDLIEWQNRIQISNDEFWKALRSLYEKQRIRLLVGRVRR